MRRFLTALITFSILVMAQNVLAITPVTQDAGPDGMIAAGLSETGVTGTSGRSSQPEPISMALLLVGLAGLTAAGDARSSQRAPERDSA